MLGPDNGPMTDGERSFFIKLGRKIAERRRELGLTQVEVAERLHVSQQAVQGFEKGRRRVPVSTLPLLAQLLDVSVEELIGTASVRPAKKRGPAPKLQRQLEEIQRLPRAKQKFVIEMLDAVIAQARRPEAS